MKNSLISLCLKNGNTVLWKPLASARFNVVLLGVCVSVVSACDSSAGNSTNKRTNAAGDPTANLLTLLTDDESLEALWGSDEAIRIAQSYPTPELPQTESPLSIQPDSRFERWTLSSMVKGSVVNTWVWTQQEFIRVALVDKTFDVSPSNWAFTEIVAQQYNQYDFSSDESVTDASAERHALGFATVSNNSIALAEAKLTIEHEGCLSTLTLQRGNEVILWPSQNCPERALFNDTVVSSTTHISPNGIQWVSHVYGQLPTGSGAVVVDRLDVLMPEGHWLKVNRSRRRSGSGPVTIAATFGGDTLNDLVWTESSANENSTPNEIRIEIPTLSKTLIVRIPEAIGREPMFGITGAQHGVTVIFEGDADAVLPGVLFLNSLNQQAL